MTHREPFRHANTHSTNFESNNLVALSFCLFSQFRFRITFTGNVTSIHNARLYCSTMLMWSDLMWNGSHFNIFMRVLFWPQTPHMHIYIRLICTCITFTFHSLHIENKFRTCVRCGGKLREKIVCLLLVVCASMAIVSSDARLISVPNIWWEEYHRNNQWMATEMDGI